MKLPIAIARGISASVAPGPLVALGWMYGLLAALALAFTVFVYLLIASGVANSAVGSQLRKGISADWLVDTLTQPGAGSKFMSVLFLAVALALVYAVASVALSGGVVSRIVDRVGSGRAVNDPFVAECGRYAGPMLRVAIVEFLFLGLTGGALVIVWVVGMIGNADNASAWTSVTVIAVVLSAIAATADVARVHVVATGDRSAIAAWRDAISHAVRRGRICSSPASSSSAVRWVAVPSMPPACPTGPDRGRGNPSAGVGHAGGGHVLVEGGEDPVGGGLAGPGLRVADRPAAQLDQAARFHPGRSIQLVGGDEPGEVAGLEGAGPDKLAGQRTRLFITGRSSRVIVFSR